MTEREREEKEREREREEKERETGKKEKKLQTQKIHGILFCRASIWLPIFTI